MDRDRNIDDCEATTEEMRSVGCTGIFLVFGLIAFIGLVGLALFFLLR